MLFLLLGGRSALYGATKPKLYEKVYATTESALQKIFPNNEFVTKQTLALLPKEMNTLSSEIGSSLTTSNYTVYVGKKEGGVTGYAIQLDEMGKYYPITMMIGITPTLEVRNITVMVYREKIGRGVRKYRFLKQFYGKTKKDPLMINQDIDGITGATVSSWSVATAVKKAIVLIDAYQTQ